MSQETQAVNFTAEECVGVMDAIDAYIVSGPAQGDTPDMLKDALQKVRDAYNRFPSQTVSDANS